MTSLADRFSEKIALRSKYDLLFLQTFGIRLSRFWDNFLGFDVVKFDEYIGPEDGESCKQAVVRRFGPEGLAIIEGLIGKGK